MQKKRLYKDICEWLTHFLQRVNFDVILMSTVLGCCELEFLWQTECVSFVWSLIDRQKIKEDRHKDRFKYGQSDT